MTLKKSAALTALLITCAVTVADVAPAHAAQPNLLELLFGKRRRQEPVPPPGVNMPMAAPGPAVAAKPAPLPKVSAPSYYTYKADPLKTIALDKVADPVVTGSIDVATVDAAPHTPESDVRREFASVKAEAPGAMRER